MSSIAYEVGSDGKPVVRRFWNTREQRYMTIVTELRPGGMQVAAEIDPVLVPNLDSRIDERFLPHDERGPGSARPASDVVAPQPQFEGSTHLRGASSATVEALQPQPVVYSTDGSHAQPAGPTDDVQAQVLAGGASADSEPGALADLAAAAGLPPTEQA